MKLRDEKAAFEEMQRERYIANQSKLDLMQSEIMDLENFNQQLVRDHVDTLATHELEERRQHEELEQIRQDNFAMREMIRQATEKSKAVRDKAKSTYISETMEYQERFREQNVLQQENISIIRDQYRKV